MQNPELSDGVLVRIQENEFLYLHKSVSFVTCLSANLLICHFAQEFLYRCCDYSPLYLSIIYIKESFHLLKTPVYLHQEYTCKDQRTEEAAIKFSVM